jgi:hypothetical protein
MSVDNVARAIMRLDNPKVRLQVASGDFGKLSDLRLTSSEKALMVEELEPDGRGRNGGATVAVLCTFAVEGKRGLLYLSSRYALAGLKDATIKRKFETFLKKQAAAR